MEEKLAGCRNRTVALKSNSSNAINSPNWSCFYYVFYNFFFLFFKYISSHTPVQTQHGPKAVDATQLASKVSQQTTLATGGDAAEHAKDH